MGSKKNIMQLAINKNTRVKHSNSIVSVSRLCLGQLLRYHIVRAQSQAL
jgi:hypothetical protein